MNLIMHEDPPVRSAGEMQAKVDASTKKSGGREDGAGGTVEEGGARSQEGEECSAQRWDGEPENCSGFKGDADVNETSEYAGGRRKRYTRTFPML
jgi:hypothetical protein